MTETKKLNGLEKLLAIQAELKAPKGQYNSFGKYKYRSAEDILESVKPLCAKYKALVVLTDAVEIVGEESFTRKTEKTEEQGLTLRSYIKATARFYDAEQNALVMEVQASARETDEKKGMDASQISGSASSYARKYALNGLFCIDDTKDADTDEYHEQTKKPAKSVEEYVKSINACEDENAINTLFYEWSKTYGKGSDGYTTLYNASVVRKNQIKGA